jgi:hypothetical protein
MRLMLGIIIGMLVTQPTEHTINSSVERENTKATGSIVFWHFKDVGGTCSADIQSPMGQVLAQVESENNRKMVITFRPFELNVINK